MVIHAATRGLVLAVTLLGAVAAYAHAHLARANPAAGAIVASAPSEVTLAFTQKLEPKFSTVVGRDASGKEADKGDPHVDEVDPSLLKVSLPTLAAGRYKVVCARHASSASLVLTRPIRSVGSQLGHSARRVRQ